MNRIHVIKFKCLVRTEDNEGMKLRTRRGRRGDQVLLLSRLVCYSRIAVDCLFVQDVNISCLGAVAEVCLRDYPVPVCE